MKSLPNCKAQRWFNLQSWRIPHTERKHLLMTKYTHDRHPISSTHMWFDDIQYKATAHLNDLILTEVGLCHTIVGVPEGKSTNARELHYLHVRHWYHYKFRLQTLQIVDRSSVQPTKIHFILCLTCWTNNFYFYALITQMIKLIT